jgi:hypothetical protein
MTLEIVVQAKAWNTSCLAFHSVIAERWWARRFAPLLTMRAFNYGNYYIMKGWVIARFLLNELQIRLGMRCQVCNSLFIKKALK